MKQFLPISAQEIAERGWEQIDFLFISGDAYVDHPSFGPAVICRVLEAQGYKVAMLCQPRWDKAEYLAELGKPRLGVLISGGNLDVQIPGHVLGAGGFPNRTNRRIIPYSDNESIERAKP